MALSCEINGRGEKVYLILKGAIRENDAAVLREHLLDLCQKGARELIIDLGEISFIGSSGIGALLMTQRRLSRAGGRLRLTGTPNFIGTLLRQMRLDYLLEFE